MSVACDPRTDGCGAACCIMYEVHYDDGTLLHVGGERCPNLTEDLRCAIYETRPKMCRNFCCADDKRIWRDFDRRLPVVS